VTARPREPRTSGARSQHTLQCCFAATAACLPFAGQLVSQLGSASASEVLDVVYLGLFPTMLGFTTWAYALARTTTYAVPGLVVLMSWLIAVSRGKKRSPAPAEVPDSVGSATG
jgi:drug/metabolite transporter (DMT)-like permease